MTKNFSAIGILFASISIFIWGITFVSTKYLLQYFSSYEILLIRFLLAYAALSIVHPKRLKLTDKKQEVFFMLAGFSGVTAYQLMENMALSYTSASNVSIIVCINPIFVALFSQIFLKEKTLTPTFIIGFFLALFGVALVTFNGVLVFHLSPKGDLMALASALCWAFYSVCISVINSYGYEQVYVTRRVFAWAIIFMIPIGLLSLMIIPPESSGLENFHISNTLSVILDREFNRLRFTNPFNWLNLGFLGFGASAFCFAIWSIACRKLGTLRASLGIYLIPVVTIIFAFIVLGEKISLMGIIGCILTIAGLFVSRMRMGK